MGDPQLVPQMLSISALSSVAPAAFTVAIFRLLQIAVHRHRVPVCQALRY